MIDSAMLNRILYQHGVASMGPSTADFFLAIAQTVWHEAQREEREACAQLCDDKTWAIDYGGAKYYRPAPADECAAAIRARGETK